MNEKLIFASLIGAVGVLLLVAIFRPSPEPRVVEPVTAAAEVVEEVAEDTNEAVAEAAEEASEAVEAATEEVVETAESTTEEAAEAVAAVTAEEATEAAPTEEATEETTAAAPTEDATEKTTEVAPTEETAPQPEVAALNARIAELEAKLAEAHSALEAPASQTTGASVGETLVLADGAVRVFVSRIADDAARLTVNGQQMTLGLGDTGMVQVDGEECGVTLDGIEGGVAASVACGAAAPASAAEPETQAEANAAAETAPVTAEAPTPEAASGAGVGETLVMADGAVRVFVSRLSDDTARLSVNGETLSLATGERAITTLNDETCGVTLDGIDDDGAAVSLACGDALPAPAGATVGETLLLEDGAIRAFVSRVTGEDARLSLNGEPATLATGGSALVTTGETPCRVTLGGIDRGYVTLSSTCDAAKAASEPVGPGATAILNDGATRVFVSAVTRNAVRFAVNGQSTLTVAPGDQVTLEDGCLLAVADDTRDGARFALSCPE